MTKKIKKLEKETTQWRSKWESNNQALLQMAEEVRNSWKQLETEERVQSPQLHVAPEVLLSWGRVSGESPAWWRWPGWALPGADQEPEPGGGSPAGDASPGDRPFSSVLQRTLRDGHFKALQGKLELLERLCRALQKERNDLNNRFSLLQKEGGREEPPPPEDPPVQEDHDPEGLPAGLEQQGVPQPHRPPGGQQEAREG